MPESPPNRAGRAAHLARFLAAWVCGFLTYWWLICKLELQQMIAGAIVGALSAFALEVLRRRTALHFAPQPGWVGLLLWRLPSRILVDLGWLGLELFRALFRGGGGTGTYKAIPFRPGGNDPRAAARRALVAFGVSVPPNTFVVSTAHQQNRMVVHELVFQHKTPNDEEWPL